MYISNITHYLDEAGNIPKKIPKESRELASFLVLIIDESTKNFTRTLSATEIRCFKKECEGNIKYELPNPSDDIHWICSKCQNEGRIFDWQGTRWDNQNGK